MPSKTEGRENENIEFRGKLCLEFTLRQELSVETQDVLQADNEKARKNVIEE